jgi:hypothetical protein
MKQFLNYSFWVSFILPLHLFTAAVLYIFRMSRTFDQKINQKNGWVIGSSTLFPAGLRF